MPSSISSSHYTDNLAIWCSSPSVPTAVETTHGALFRLNRWSEYWCRPLNPSKCKASFSVDPHQANLLLLNSRLRFNRTPTFSWGHLPPHSFLSKHLFSLMTKIFPRLKALPHGAPLRNPPVFRKNLFFGPFSLMVCFLKRYQFHQIGTPPPSGRAIIGCLPSSPIPLLFSEASLPPLKSP